MDLQDPSKFILYVDDKEIVCLSLDEAKSVARFYISKYKRRLKIESVSPSVSHNRSWRYYPKLQNWVESNAG